MAVFITGAGIVPEKPPMTTVTLSGTGNSTYCYATVDGSKKTGSGTVTLIGTGKQIAFGVYGRSTTYYGEVKIDGTQVLKVTNQTTQTYTWTIPDGVSAVTISFSYTSTSSQRRGRITVTTS